MHKAEKLTIGAIALLICGLTLVGLLADYPRQAILFPILTSVCVLAFALLRWIEMIRSQRRLADPEIPDDPADKEDRLEVRAALVPFAWVFGALAFIALFGFLIGLPIYVLVFLIAHRIAVRQAVPIALGTLAFIYVVFVKILGVLLPAGLIGRAVIRAVGL